MNGLNGESLRLTERQHRALTLKSQGLAVSLIAKRLACKSRSVYSLFYRARGRQQPPDKEPLLRDKLDAFWTKNPEVVMTYAELCVRFGCTKKQAIVARKNLNRNGRMLTVSVRGLIRVVED